MKTFTIQHQPTETDFITTDFMDVWSQFENLPESEPITVIVQEMTVAEFESEVKRRGHVPE